MSHAPTRRSGALLALGVVALACSDVRAEGPPAPPAAAPAADVAVAATRESVWCRELLTGDWCGARSCLAQRGLTLQFESTHTTQVTFGDSDQNDFDIGGRLDAFVRLDTQKSGLWCGGEFTTHLEYRYGDLPAYLGGALMATNTAQLTPEGAPEELVATAIFLTQALGSSASLTVGKINVIDEDDADAFFGGGGRYRFLNVAFTAPPNGVLPSVVMGAAVSVVTEPFTWTAMVYDPNDRTTDYFPGDLFEDGVTAMLDGTWDGCVFGRTTSLGMQGYYSTRTGTDLSDVRLRDDLTAGREQGSYCLSAVLSHMLCERAGSPGTGWGVHATFGLCDGNPNPIRGFFVGGISSTGPFACRPLDAFGLGYYRYWWSDDLESTLSPLFDLDDEHGVEVFYDLAVTPWLHVAADLQVIDPGLGRFPTEWIGGLRLNLRF